MVSVRLMDIRENYYNWLCRQIAPAGPIHSERRYEYLLRWLYSRPFRFILSMDQNRSVDGINLRYAYAAEMHIPQAQVAVELDNVDCSMLEMMVALDRRCVLMEYELPGENFGKFFWTMIQNLGLYGPFDPEEAELAVSRVENRDYAPDGLGGLFWLQHPRADLRGVDIWYQAMWYIAENSNSEVE